jgi:hypothetical protein
MPRQLTDPYADLVLPDRVAEIHEGGTGANNTIEAIDNLGGISRVMLGRPGGVAMANSLGKFPIPGNATAVSEALEGPRQIVRGATVTYLITNYDSRRPVNVSISAGSVSRSGDEIRVVAPMTGNSVVLTVGGRSVTIPLVDGGLVKPLVIYPKPGQLFEVREVTLSADEFKYSPEVLSSWNTVSILNGNINFPAGAHAIEIYGAKGGNGTAVVTVDGVDYNFPTTEVRRKIYKGLGASFGVRRSGTGVLRWRAITSGARHTATDWQVARDAAFTDIVAQSLNDTVNKTQWTVELETGSYYVRVRFHGNTA